MKHAGVLPMKNGHELDRAAVAVSYGWRGDEVDQAAQVFKAMHRRRPDSTITFREYLDLMRAAGLRPSQVGKRAGQYQFARHGDVGDYSATNARFVPGEVNQAERAKPAHGTEFRARLSTLALQRDRLPCDRCGDSFTPGMLARWHGEKCSSTASKGHA